jgi:carbamoyltransferase
MYILGISCFRDDATAALLQGGNIVGIAEEERYVRVKHAVKLIDGVFVTSLDESGPINDFELRFFPSHAIDDLIAQAGIELQDIDVVAYDLDIDQRIDRLHEFKPIYGITSESERKRLVAGWRYWQRLLEEFARRCQAELIYVPHHVAHANGTVFWSGFSETNFLIIDGLAELTSTTLGHFDGEFKIFKTVPLPHSLGMFYSAVTSFLGFRPFSHEQKTMGLSAYGNDKYHDQMDQLAWTTADGFETNAAMIWTQDVRMHPNLSPSALPSLIGFPPRDPSAPATKGEYPHVASSLQHRLEHIVFHLIDLLQKENPSDALCLAGGVALNSQMNGKIARRPDIKHLFIQPQAGDSGTAVGAAFYAYHRLTGKHPVPVHHAYWGTQHSNGDVEAVLQKMKLPYEKPDDIYRDTARLLAQGKIVGWFQGRSECGPRALGNRSILADCSFAGMDEVINRHVKNREPWRPFAASILDGMRTEYLEMDMSAPYMLLTIPLTDKGSNEFVAASHVNGTTRPQTVNKQSNPRFTRLLEAYRSQTGKGALLNTSFNVRGEPIVNSPSEAIRDFFLTGMDALVIHDCLLRKGA